MANESWSGMLICTRPMATTMSRTEATALLIQEMRNSKIGREHV
mgnify:CR=1 FL=1